jgi:hypothetical protein
MAKRINVPLAAGKPQAGSTGLPGGHQAIDSMGIATAAAAGSGLMAHSILNVRPRALLLQLKRVMRRLDAFPARAPVDRPTSASLALAGLLCRSQGQFLDGCIRNV